MDTPTPETQLAPPPLTYSGETIAGRGSWSAAPTQHKTRTTRRAGRITVSLVVFVVALTSVSCGDGDDDAASRDVPNTTSSTTVITSTPTMALSTSTSGTTALTRSELPEVVDRWVAAILAGDAAAVARCYTDDGVWVDHGHPTIRELRRVSIAGTLSEAFRYLTLTEVTLPSEVRTGDAILTEWKWSGTSSNHSRAATDQTPFTTDVEFLFTFDGDLIKTSEFSYDYTSLFN